MWLAFLEATPSSENGINEPVVLKTGASDMEREAAPMAKEALEYPLATRGR
jgi:hypothetical protein